MREADEKLRDSRLVFYKEDIDKIDKMLEEMLRLSKAKCALLIDKDGHLVTKQGGSSSYDTDTIAALVAGSFAATKEMARILGEEEFSVLFHQGKKDNIHLTLVGNRTLLAIIFDDKTTVGMVRLYSNEVTKKMVQVFQDAGKRTGPAPQVAKGYADAAQNKVDEFFRD
ncbi:MAG: roadblock/LC7 domain-containing protein [Candidatus Brocadiae bacterium]|nr:roadblock/LC7 domain-containing protein [Candidatus Brocadiia bacterium]